MTTLVDSFDGPSVTIFTSPYNPGTGRLTDDQFTWGLSVTSGNDSYEMLGHDKSHWRALCLAYIARMPERELPGITENLYDTIHYYYPEWLRPPEAEHEIRLRRPMPAVSIAPVPPGSEIT